MRIDMHRPVRFLRYWRGRTKGRVDKLLSPGVRAELVRRKICEWVDTPAVPEVKAEAVAEAVETPAPPPPDDANRHRNRRR
jgi:hypothetical protein